MRDVEIEPVLNFIHTYNTSNRDECKPLHSIFL